MAATASSPRNLIRRLRFQQLELLCEVAACGSLGGAASRMHITRAAASKAVLELEALFGLSLFERSSAGMRATAAGLRIVEHARLLLHELGNLSREAAAIGRSPNSASLGTLRVGAPPFLIEHLVPTVLSRLAARLAPREWTAHLVEGSLSALIEQLLLGELDAILTLFSPRAVDAMDLSMLEIRPFAEVPMVTVASPSLIPRGRAGQSLEALRRLPWILPPRSTHLRRIVEEVFKAHGVHPPEMRIESWSLSANAHMAEAGLGLAVVPLQLVASQVQAGHLRLLKLPQALPPTSVALMYRKISALYREVVRSLAEAVVEDAAEYS